MKLILIVFVLALTGCSGYSTLEELEAQALVTGDWSAVEKRERIIARRAARRGPKCPTGSVSVCQNDLGSKRCSCMQQESVRDILARGFSNY